MTPEEKAVVQAAIEWRRSHMVMATQGTEAALRDAVNAMTDACQRCNYERHQCPGCGADVGHGDTACSVCIARASGTTAEGGIFAESADAAELRNAGTKFWRQHIESQLVNAEQARKYPREDPIEAHPCDDSTPHDAHDHELQTAEAQPTGVPAEYTNFHCPGVEAKSDPLIWVPRTWADVRAGDTVRMPGTDSTARVVSAVHRAIEDGSNWHVHPAADEYRPNEMPANWSEVYVGLDVGDGFEKSRYSMDPNGPIEIQATQAEADAIELLGGWPARVGIITE